MGCCAVAVAVPSCEAMGGHATPLYLQRCHATLTSVICAKKKEIQLN
jgi:hypothetical protein